jgi:Co/Zn/Cd efflux system component
VALINDGLDTLLDGLSSLLVYVGARFDKELAINLVLVLVVLVTGGFTFYEAVRRFFVPLAPEVDWFTFLATILSALVCLVLWVYQRFTGLRSGTMALITQSADSRNHVIVAVGVTAGLVAAALLHIALPDTLVGLAIVPLTLKSAAELAIETVRSLGKEEIDLSRFEFRIAVQYEKLQQAQLRDWMLYLVETQAIETRSELVARARQALDFNRIAAVGAMGLVQRQPHVDELIERSLAELFQRGWLAEGERLTVIDLGRKHLGKWV